MPAAGGTGCRPFSLLTGVSLVVGYALLGATWLIMKTEGSLQDARLPPRAHRPASPPSSASARSAPRRRSSSDAYYERWFAWPQGPVHRAGAAAGRDRHRWPSSSACTRRYETLAVPARARPVRAQPGRPRRSASSPTSCRARSRSGTPPRPTPARSSCWSAPVILIPIILAYTGYSYWVFRGKVGHEGYH